MESTKCVLCFNEFSPNYRYSEETVIVGDVLKPERIISEGDGDNPVNNQLKLKFLLRKILEISQDKCSNFLVDDGDPCSSSLINCCDSCSVLVGKGKLILDQINELQNQFQKLQNRLKHIIISSVFEENASNKYTWGAQGAFRLLIITGASNLKVTVREEEKVEGFSYSDTNLSSEQLSSFPGGSSLSSDVVHDQWSEVEESSSDEDDQDNSQEQDPIGLAEANGNPEFINVVDIKTETQSCYLFEDEQAVRQEEQILISEVNSDPNTINGDINDPLIIGNVTNISYNCKLCDQSFIDIISLKTHEKTHTAGSIIYKCEICDRSFECADRFTDHKNTHAWENIPSRHKCAICGKYFISLRERQLHELIHTGKNPTKCEICGEEFTQLRFLRTHEKTKHKINHSRKNEYKCQFCEKVFNKSSKLKIHERIHTGEKPYKCQFCEKAFRSSNHIREHERNHTGEKPYKCQFCEKVFMSSSSAKVHERTHSGEKPYKCQFCEKVFSSSSYAKVHERTHSGERPYKCQFCEKVFSSSSYAKVHERTHTAEKQHKCQFCEKLFITSSEAKGHEITHFGEYKCDICGERFDRSQKLNSHTIKSHGFWR